MAGRRISLYFSWSRPDEIGQDLESLGVLENRFPALFEFRRAIWPYYEHASDPNMFRQDVSGFMDHVILADFQRFREVMEAATGNRVDVVHRVREASPEDASPGPKYSPITLKYLNGCETLIVASLDHIRTRQVPAPEEIAAVREFLRRENSCLVLSPHHAVGVPEGLAAREVEHRHHGDPLVPAQQLFGGYARGLLAGLGIPIENRFGLSPDRSADGSPGLLDAVRDLDSLGVLKGVTTFNLHPHLPHLHVDPASLVPVRILARQPINPAAPHPFMAEGNRHLNALIWVPPGGERGGHVFVCDATLWSAAFGGVESLMRFWQNLAQL